jgi:uncharacterized protein YndB with AHSA1/START domain
MASAETDIQATPQRVWEALTDPAQVAKYMFGTRIESTWQPGTPITWRGEYEGKKYEDHGEVLEVVPGRRLKVTHFSPLGGQKDVPENYHTVTYDLEDRGGRTHVVLKQDNNADVDEAKHSAANWETMLAGLKKHVESA